MISLGGVEISRLDRSQGSAMAGNRGVYKTVVWGLSGAHKRIVLLPYCISTVGDIPPALALQFTVWTVTPSGKMV
ncbi:hypothetical protein Y032_0024g904 [Ancylostoma ceylanicum]|uniref:Uncharacterized protein n=1 Tax=Ancylostoma ceylanicum TaxID=53326 RepID=A0A016UWD7_9BILA|nr:hypothetical protein Y032_0024g904 [Ancylostoma ceylanicum]